MVGREKGICYNTSATAIAYTGFVLFPAMACALFWGVLQCLLLTTRSVRPTFLQARSALYDGFSKADFDALWRLAEQQVQSPSPEVQQETGHHKVLQKKLPCQSTIMGPKGVNNCEFRAYPRNEMVLEKNGWLYAPALLKLVLNPRILKAVEEITGAEPLLWGANIGTAQPGDLQAWHLDVEMGDCWNRSLPCRPGASEGRHFGT